MILKRITAKKNNLRLFDIENISTHGGSLRYYICKNNSNTTISNNNINSHNKTFNLQFFLNETCKDAMNIMDFVDEI